MRVLSSSYLGSVIISYLLPGVEWPFFRTMGQLWYEIFEFKANLSPALISATLDKGDAESLITCMHPHGIIPFQGIIWAAYCDQYLKDKDRFCYGFGATADAVLYLPFLRNIMMWLTAGPAGRDVLHKGLVDGDVSMAPKRKVKHLYILPGGIAEIFTSNIGRNAMIIKNRYGLMKLSVTTGARLAPSYVFGGNDFFYNIANEKSLLAKVSRKFKMGMLLFCGFMGLPMIPFTPQVSLCLGDPLAIPDKLDKQGNERPLDERVRELHQNYISAMQALFNKYKKEAGYPDSELEIL